MKLAFQKGSGSSKHLHLKFQFCNESPKALSRAQESRGAPVALSWSPTSPADSSPCTMTYLPKPYGSFGVNKLNNPRTLHTRPWTRFLIRDGGPYRQMENTLAQ